MAGRAIRIPGINWRASSLLSFNGSVSLYLYKRHTAMEEGEEMARVDDQPFHGDYLVLLVSSDDFYLFGMIGTFNSLSRKENLAYQVYRMEAKYLHIRVKNNRVRVGWFRTISLEEMVDRIKPYMKDIKGVVVEEKGGSDLFYIQRILPGLDMIPVWKGLRNICKEDLVVLKMAPGLDPKAIGYINFITLI